MPALWTYPWSLAAEGVDAAFTDIADRGVDALNVASHYHSVRTTQPRHPESLLERYPAGCYFVPSDDRFSTTPLEPAVNTVGEMGDPLETVVNAGEDHGIDVNAWTVCLHGSRLAENNPEYCAETAFGDPIGQSVCPSHDAVQDYFQAVAAASAARGVTEVHLESVGYPSAFHPHDSIHGHEKHQLRFDPTARTLLSQCFCDGCKEAARRTSVDLDEAQAIVQNVLRSTLSGTETDLPELDVLVEDRPVLQRLLDFRADTITNLVARIGDGAGDVPLNYYVMEWPGLEPGDGWRTGVRLEELEPILDRMTALCYVSKPEKAASRVQSLRDTVSVPITAGVTVDPEIVETEDQFRALVGAVEQAGADDTFVYNHGLMTETHLDWITETFT